MGADPGIFLGGVTYISSSGIIARTLDDLGWMANRETSLVLAILVIEDLVMAAFLPLATVLLVGGAAATVGFSVALAVAVVVSALAVGARFGPAISRAVFSRSDEALLLGILGLLLLTAGVFFIFFGFQVDPGTIPGAVVPSLALAAVGAGTKYATGWIAARRAGIGRRGRIRAGVGLVARGEFSIVIAGLAVAGGAEPELGSIAATYVLLLAAAGPIAARLVAHRDVVRAGPSRG